MERSRLPWRRPVVLAYHGVGTPDERDDPVHLVVPPSDLRAHISLLRRLGYRFRTASEVLEIGGGASPPPRTAVLTFDDGWRNGLTVLLPILRELEVPASFYLCPGWWGRQHPDVRGDHGRLLDEEEARALHEAGMDLGSHSMVHADLREMDDETLRTDLRESKARLEAVTGAPCRTFAYPFGLFGDREERAVRRAGYELAWGWLPGPWRPLAAPRLPGPPRHGARRLALKMLGIRRRAGEG